MRCLVDDSAAITDVDTDGIKEHDRVKRIQPAVLPFQYRFQHAVGDVADRLMGHVHPIRGSDVVLDIPYRHATGVQRDDRCHRAA